uniref:Uncharacterized protein n=1 Tax=Physcomitrium patens TaxID=3218 RepID=A0A2K1K670_PHYPA|nr:hypothetical protein PHYPA_011158 [Physcomitrium patens]
MPCHLKPMLLLQKDTKYHKWLLLVSSLFLHINFKINNKHGFFIQVLVQCTIIIST